MGRRVFGVRMWEGPGYCLHARTRGLGFLGFLEGSPTTGDSVVCERASTGLAFTYGVATVPASGWGDAGGRTAAILWNLSL